MAVMHDGKLTVAAAGVVNVTTGVRVTADTLFHIGSITKVFNATLVMQLMDEGKVALDEPIIRYLPELKISGREATDRITVKMLLNHTSGIDGEVMPDQGHDEETIEKAIARLSARQQLFTPGSEFSYCNAGTVIAGFLAQRLCDRSWYRLIRERIFRPLNMKHAATLPEEALLHRASVGHHLDLASKRLNRTSFAFLPMSYGPAGTTLMMSAMDLIAFAQAHMGEGTGANGVRILSGASAKAMQQRTVNNTGKYYTYLDMGIGWMVSDDGLLTHGGGGPGIVSALYVHPGRRFSSAVLTNAAHGLNLINEFMEPWLKELGTVKPYGTANVPVPKQSVQVDAAKYVGRYEDALSRYVVSAGLKGVMFSRQEKWAYYDDISTEPTQPVCAVPLGDHQFLLEADCNRPAAAAHRVVAFRNPDETGRMQHIGNRMLLYKRTSPQS